MKDRCIRLCTPTLVNGKSVKYVNSIEGPDAEVKLEREHFSTLELDTAV